MSVANELEKLVNLRNSGVLTEEEYQIQKSRLLGQPKSSQLDDTPPIAPGHRQDYKDYDIGLTLRSRNCTLAYLSLGLVCFSILTGGILLLPGIICGHVALGQCNRDPQMVGRPYAVAALSVGYILVGVAVLMLFGLIGYFSQVK